MKKKLKVKLDRVIIVAAKGMFPSARKLANALQPETKRKVLLVKPDSNTFKHRETDELINWGCSHHPNWFDARKGHFINDPAANAIAVNKLKTFQALQDKVNIPEWTTDPKDIQNTGEWLARTNLTGFGGDGIILFDSNKDECPDAKLYVQYKKKKKEFRVHVFGNEVIDVTQKKKRTNFDGEVNTKIRNYGNGWVYCREDIEIPNDLFDQARAALEAVGLTFGAVDIIWNEKENKSYVLEINTAPGLEGTTIESYKNAILNEIK